MITRRVRTRLTEAQVARVVRTTGESIAVPQQTRLRRIYENNLFFSVFSSWHKSFKAKSDGKADEFGDKWKPLKPETIERKLRLRAGARRRRFGATTFNPEFKFGSARRRLLFRREEKYQLLRGATPRQARQRAAVRAYRLTGETAGIRINVRTGKLENSITPGSFSRNRYYRRRDQIAEIQGNVLTIGTEVQYAADVDADRRLLPVGSKLVVWVQRGVEAASEAVAAEIVRRLLRR